LLTGSVTSIAAQGMFATDASLQGVADIVNALSGGTGSYNTGHGYIVNSDETVTTGLTIWGRPHDLVEAITNTPFGPIAQPIYNPTAATLLCAKIQYVPPPNLGIPTPCSFQQLVDVFAIGPGVNVGNDPITCIETGVTLWSTCGSVSFCQDATGVTRTYAVEAGSYTFCTGAFDTLKFSAGSGSATVPTGVTINVTGPS
jgi:hypothetical protein